MVDRDELRDAAIEAELHTGRVETTRAEALRHVLVRTARVAAGSTLCLLGLAMLVLPGPGVVVLAAGLVTLSVDVPWAARLLRWLRRKAPGIEEDGPLPMGAVIASGALLVVGLGLWVVWLVALR
ncbi:MAG: PGPGW domain-containing protein [Acidimicrobiales bacterium]